MILWYKFSSMILYSFCVNCVTKQKIIWKKGLYSVNAQGKYSYIEIFEIIKKNPSYNT